MTETTNIDNDNIHYPRLQWTNYKKRVKQTINHTFITKNKYPQNILVYSHKTKVPHNKNSYREEIQLDISFRLIT